MATYKGRQNWCGTVVTVDGSPLPPRHDLRNHSPDGLAWGYAGSGPAQLALALLAHHFAHGDPQEVADLKALALYQDFKAKLIASLPAKGWQLRTHDIADTVQLVVKDAALTMFERAIQKEAENASLKRDLTECYALLEKCSD